MSAHVFLIDQTRCETNAIIDHFSSILLKHQCYIIYTHRIHIEGGISLESD